MLSKLDVFYLAQLATAICRDSDYFNGQFPKAADFDNFIVRHPDLLSRDTWKIYYSLSFLAQLATTYLWRLRDLKGLPESSDKMFQPRVKG
jgi:hypothetical protein